MLDFITPTDLLIGGAIIAAAVGAVALGRLWAHRQERERDPGDGPTSNTR